MRRGQRKRPTVAVTTAIAFAVCSGCAQAARDPVPPAADTRPAQSQSATDSRPAQSSTALQKLVSDDTAPGCAAAVGERGEVIWQEARGLADIDAGTKITAQTVFDVASVSKQFTATAVLLAVEAKRVSLDDHVSQHLTGLPPWADRVTVEQLMHHVSGIPNYVTILREQGHPLEQVTNRNLALTAIAGTKLNFRPGSKWEYSNSNYLLLGVMLEKIFDEPLPTLLHRLIFEPLQLGMIASPTGDVPRKARSYHAKAKGAGYELADWHWDVLGSGGVQATPTDLVGWADNYRAKTVGGATLNKRQLAGAEPTGVEDSRYGAGIYAYPDGTLRHGGEYGGFHTVFVVSADRTRALAIACNLAELDASALGNELQSIWLTP